jgi:hypothetical protein
MLQLRHVLLSRGLFRKRPRQHEFGLEHGLSALDPTIQGGCHPAQDRMPDSPLDIDKYLPGIGLIPAPIEVLGHNPKLDQEIAGQVRRFDLAPLFPPEPHERTLIIAHNDSGIRAADEITVLWSLSF